ncbi:hypothetical protein [Rubellicoccus peritrichatus]|uniref:Uncharacterized protein n=1 Tax=Rubellicoccus peritrichatus TaxID=3080537 RepID=A0AAQ3QUH8_9BACT|nr:hypothetical protein [Puniceicoccus sp. CR14]WOO39737.1 hypothetical protein RZN69_14025 [Puniceicoccus sp. CR14]
MNSSFVLPAKAVAFFLLIPIITVAGVKIPKGMTVNEAADVVQASHNIVAWWGKEIVQADVMIEFEGNTIVDGTFTFEAHGPRSRYDRRDGVSIIYDGETAWITPADAQAPKGRFHVLTWPWFIMAPFKMQGDGIELTELETTEIEGKEYGSMLQTFSRGMGDTPDDWYRFYVDLDTLNVDAMAYIVTYGVDFNQANAQPSIIRYFDYTNEGGPRIATRYEFWFWDPEKKTHVGQSPKGVGTVESIRYLEKEDVDFSIPPDAGELALPSRG